MYKSLFPYVDNSKGEFDELAFDALPDSGKINKIDAMLT